jgi:hypothetical protein
MSQGLKPILCWFVDARAKARAYLRSESKEKYCSCRKFMNRFLGKRVTISAEIIAGPPFNSSCKVDREIYSSYSLQTSRRRCLTVINNS